MATVKEQLKELEEIEAEFERVNAGMDEWERKYAHLLSGSKWLTILNSVSLPNIITIFTLGSIWNRRHTYNSLWIL